jgi:glycerol kinase
MEKEIQKTVKQISNKKEVAAISIENTTETTLEWDEDELKKYVRYIIKEVRKR